MVCDLFTNRDQKEITIIDDHNNKRYTCKLHFSKTNYKKIYIGKGWNDYVKANNLKEDDNLMFVLNKHPISLNVSIVDKT
jgi:hypothetical protein